MAAVVDVLVAEHGVSGAGFDQGRLERLQGVLGLTEDDVRLLVAAAAPEIDGNVALAYALLQGDHTRVRLTAGLALELAGLGSVDAAARARLASRSPLVQAGLLEVSGEQPFLLRSLTVPDRVVAHLLGDDAPDPLVQPVIVPSVPVPGPATEVLARAVSLGAGLVWVRESSGGAGLALATSALQELGLLWIAVDAHRMHPRLADTVAAAVREAVLLGAALVVTSGDTLVEEPRLLLRLEESAVPVVVVGRRSWDPAWLPTLPLTLEAGVLDATVRQGLWRTVLTGVGVDGEDEHWRDLFALRVTPEEMYRVVRTAADDSAARDRPVSVAAVRSAARRLGGASTGTSAASPVATFDDLVLPAATADAVRELVDWARNRDEVLGQGPVAGAGGKGRGIAAMFVGGPGTGKTLAAQVVAGSLGLDLHTVDLSSVVDKYIGETEKNLEKVFREAEALNVVLFFDEADALFGNRSEVKDARDRYANQEVAYLLQRMESFNGIAVLASNLRGNLDAAFTRRLHFIVHFPDPTPDIREKLWRRHLSALAGSDPTDPVDVVLLAERAEVSGGEIRNIVLAAAYAAAAEGGLVGARILARATEREYRKLGRRLPERGFR